MRLQKKSILAKYPYQCMQPELAKQIQCGYLGAGCTYNCLMPYSGCCMQRVNEIDNGGSDNDD